MTASDRAGTTAEQHLDLVHWHMLLRGVRRCAFSGRRHGDVNGLHGAEIERDTGAFVEECQIRQVLDAGLRRGGSGPRDPAKSFMRSEAAVASAAGRGRGGGWPRRCWHGRPGAAG